MYKKYHRIPKINISNQNKILLFLILNNKKKYLYEIWIICVNSD